LKQDENINAVFTDVREYWRIYGGSSAFFKSPYLFMSILFTAISLCYWNDSGEWTSDVIDIIPSILGFSLGGYAIFMAFSDDKFLELLVDDEDENSFYMALNAQFVHFILVQVFSILLAIICKNILPSNEDYFEIWDKVLSMFGFLSFSYALFTAVATAFSLLSFGRLYHQYKNESKQ